MSPTPPIRPASTLALLRDGEQGLEVLLLRRTLKAVFMPGRYVFPGGAVDAGDDHPELRAAVRGTGADDVNRMLRVEDGGLGYLLAGVRECFEEAGVLLARDQQGDWVEDGHPALAQRRAVAGGELDMATLCREHDLYLPLDGLVYLDHWITPPGRPRRFDTRFFAAAAPPRQTPAHDGEETIDNVWLRPAQALEDHHAGRREFAIPTCAVLERLMSFSSVPEVLEKVPAEPPQRIGGLAG